MSQEEMEKRLDRVEKRLAALEEAASLATPVRADDVPEPPVAAAPPPVEKQEETVSAMERILAWKREEAARLEPAPSVAVSGNTGNIGNIGNAEKPSVGVDWEALVGGNLLNYAGILAIFLGFAFS